MSWYKEGETKGEFVYVADEVQLTKLLGPDGQPYAIRRTKNIVGFDLSPKQCKNIVDLCINIG